MSDVDDAESPDPFRVLAERAEYLNRIRGRWLFAGAFYDPLAGAIRWTDETRWRTPATTISALRALWYHRTRLMIPRPPSDQPEVDEFAAELLRFGLAHFPRWAGFRPERPVATPLILHIYRRGQACVRKWMRDFERENPE